MMQVIFATNNLHKLEEVQALLGADYKIITPRDLGVLEDIPEESETIEGNASQKSHYLYDRTGENCFADDTGLEVDALGGAPGVYSARYSGVAHDSEANMKLLLRNMEGQSNRKARFRTVIALILGGVEHQFEGVVNGVITTEPCGSEGFGYDPIFIPEGCSTTFAQMSGEAKNRISHRGIAVRRLVEYLSAK